MSAGVFVTFNLLVNGIGSFAVGYLLSRAALPLLRHTPGKLTSLLFAMPFVKIAFDLARGIPADSFLWLRARGISQDLGSFMVGVGVQLGVPKIDLAFGAMHDGRRYAQSAADLAASGLIKVAGGAAPLVVVGVLLAVAMLLLGRRASTWWALILRRRALEAELPLGELALGRRSIRMVQDPDAAAPYTGGVLAPFVAVPSTFSSLPPDERAAAVAHELGHVAERHVLSTAIIGVFTDLFWFVPGIRAAGRAFRASCEASADRWAVDHGTDPVVLASALVRFQEVASAARGCPAASLSVVESAVFERVRRLLGDEPRPRFALAHPGARLCVAAWSVAAVLSAAGFGNH